MTVLFTIGAARGSNHDFDLMRRAGRRDPPDQVKP